jgi:hypothetical protein
MSFISRATEAPKPRTGNAWLASLLLAAFFISMIVGQLFTFEDFPGVLGSMWLPGGETFAVMAAAVIVTLEVLTLPFLLRLRLSVAMRVVSMMAGWLVLVIWLVISLGNVLSGSVVNGGLMGATVPLPVGWWGVLFCIALGTLAAWSAWGMWPLGTRKK